MRKVAGDVTGIQHRTIDDSRLLQGTITFVAGDTLTTEKKTSALSLLKKRLAPDHRCLLVVDRTDDATAANMTFKTYIQVKIDDATTSDVLVDSQTVENVVGARGAEAFVLDEGLGCGDGTIKFGALFAVDSGAVTVNYALYAL